MRTVAKALVLLLATITAFLANAYVQDFIRLEVFGNHFPRGYPDMVTCALVGAVVASILVSLPLAMTFRGKSWLAAMVASSPVVALRLNDFTAHAGAFDSQIKMMAIIEAASYVVFLVGGSLLASLIWKRHDGHAGPNYAET